MIDKRAEREIEQGFDHLISYQQCLDEALRSFRLEAKTVGPQAQSFRRAAVDALKRAAELRPLAMQTETRMRRLASLE